MRVCVPSSVLVLSCVCWCWGVLLPVPLPNLPFLACLSMSTLESVTYLPEKGLYCQRLPSSRTHGGTESLKGKNTENMGFYGTLKMIFYKVSNLFSSCAVWLCVCVCLPEKENLYHQRWLQYPLILVGGWMSGILFYFMTVVSKHGAMGWAGRSFKIKCTFPAENFSLKMYLRLQKCSSVKCWPGNTQPHLAFREPFCSVFLNHRHTYVFIS